MRALTFVVGFVAAMLIAVTAGWGVLAIHYSDLPSAVLRTSLAVLFGLLALATLTRLALRRWRRRALMAYLQHEHIESEAKGFWPIYDACQKDLQQLDARLEKTIKAYAYATSAPRML